MVPPAQTRAPEPLPSPFQALSHCRHGDRGAWAAAWASAQRPRPSGTGRNDTPGLFITQRDGPPHLAQGPLGVPHPTSQPSAQSVLCAQLLLCAEPLYMAQDSATSVWLLADVGREMSLWSLKPVPRPVGWLCSGQEKCHACPPRLSTASVPVRVPAGDWPAPSSAGDKASWEAGRGHSPGMQDSACLCSHHLAGEPLGGRCRGGTPSNS